MIGGIKLSSNNLRYSIISIFGLVLSILGILMYQYDPLNLFIDNQLKLHPGSLMNTFFQDPPVDVTINLYVFNVTNHEDFLAKKEKLRVEQIGPYVYQEFILNEHIEYNPNGTVTFIPRRWVKFRPDLSVGDASKDFIISPNIPLLGISSSLYDKSMISNLVVSQIANVLNAKPFLKLTIEQYLWGYDDKLVTLAHKALPHWINFPRFGIMDRLLSLDNKTNVITIKTTDAKIFDADYLSDQEKHFPYTINEYNGSPGLSHWGYDDSKRNATESSPENCRCNSLEGAFESGIFPTKMMNENTTLWIYRRAFCRPLQLKYHSTGVTNHMEVLTFKPPQNYMDTPDNNPLNACYCYEGRCAPKGTSYLSPCYYGIPVTISKPHFLDAEPAFIDSVEGMKPDPIKHDFYMSLHKRGGFPVDTSLRIQINLDVRTKYSSKCAPFNGLMLPLFWIEMRVERLHTHIQVALFILDHVMPVLVVLVPFLLILFGISMMAAGVLFAFFASQHVGLEDPYDNRIAYSPIRIIPVNQYLNPPSIRLSK